MTIFETMMEVENEIVKLECAEAVLSEAGNYFDGETTGDKKFDAAYLYLQREHIQLLLYVVSNIIQATCPKLETVVNELCRLSKESKKNE